MSEPSQSTDAEPPTEVDEDEYPDVDAEPTEGTGRTETTDAGTAAEGEAEGEADAEAAAEDDAEDVESEWHVWILGLIAVAGIAIFFAPGWLVPELLGTLGAFLVAIGVLGLVLKWAIERSA